MLEDDAGFLEKLPYRSDEDPIWSIYADWLEEHRDERTEFLRHQAWMRSLPEDDPDRLFLMRWCPPGKFVMGSPADEAGRRLDCENQVEVELTEGFWVGKFPVTQREYERLVGSNPSWFSLTGGGRYSERFGYDSVPGRGCLLGGCGEICRASDQALSS